VFLRYGHARTTMNDVAEEAGISRPALYLVFQRKEDIFAAVIDRLIEDELQKYREAFPKLRTLGRKLHFCCEQWAGHGYDLTKAHPDARDVFNLAFEPVKKMYDALVAFLADLLREAVSASDLKTTPEELARSDLRNARFEGHCRRRDAHEAFDRASGRSCAGFVEGPIKPVGASIPKIALTSI